MKYLLLTFFLLASVGIAAESKIIIEPADIHLPDAKVTDSDLKNYYQTQIELLRSELLMKRVSKKVQLDGNPAIAVSRMPDTSIFTVKVTGLGKKDREYLDTLLDEFIGYKKELRTQAAKKAKEQIEDQITKTEDPKLKEKLQQKLFDLEIESEIAADVISRLN